MPPSKTLFLIFAHVFCMTATTSMLAQESYLKSASKKKLEDGGKNVRRLLHADRRSEKRKLVEDATARLRQKRGGRVKERAVQQRNLRRTSNTTMTMAFTREGGVCTVSGLGITCKLPCQDEDEFEIAGGVYVGNAYIEHQDDFVDWELCADDGVRRLNSAAKQGPHYYNPKQSSGCAESEFKLGRLKFARISYNEPQGSKVHFHRFRTVKIDTSTQTWCKAECGNSNRSKSRGNRPRLFDQSVESDEMADMWVKSCGNGGTVHFGGANEPATDAIYILD
eukprot:scaffold795_cov113-Cylindrotheca_fusiformis.AAC.1